MPTLQTERSRKLPREACSWKLGFNFTLRRYELGLMDTIKWKAGAWLDREDQKVQRLSPDPSPLPRRQDA